MATAEQALARVSSLHQRLNGRRAEIDKQFAYFEGKQPLAYATTEWRTMHEGRYRDFADNWCGVVARAPVDRLRIDGFRLGKTDDLMTPDEQQLWTDWNRNEMGAQSNQGFLASTIAKRSAVLVWGDQNDEPVATWEHPAQVIVDYAADGSHRRVAALKAWVDGNMEYATLYLPDEVWKYERATYVDTGRTESGLYVPARATGAGGWSLRDVSGEPNPQPNPLGEVPVVEWANRPLLGHQPVSDIAGTMAMQDAINLLWAYLFTAADHASMPARVVLGMEPPKIPILDEAGQVVGSKPAKMEDLAKGRLLFLPGSDKGSIAQWDAAKLDVFTGVITQSVGHVAAQTSTPGHYLLTNKEFANLNGDALTAAEVPLATKVGNQQTHFSPQAKETARLFALVRGRTDLAQAIRDTDGRQFTQWKDPSMHSDSQVADAATKDRSVGMSLRTVLERRYGMTEQEIDRELTRIREERADPTMDRLTEGLLNGSADLGN